ncbi:Hint domain-containing protein, partial [Litoreibacter sp.]|nr:Hint domain-containing protein [Litoreibacter sp.]
WIGQRTVQAEGVMTPIQIDANTFGKHRALSVSPQHRVMIRDQKAELLFGQDEVLVAAKDLVNDTSVRQCASAATVTYVHILFDEHQVIYSEGLLTESFLPGPQTMNGFEAETVNEICTIFPELDPETGLGYGTAARTSLKAFEAQLLMRPAYAA